MTSSPDDQAGSPAAQDALIRILLVEDSLEIAQMVIALLSDSGNFQITVAQDGIRGLRLALSQEWRLWSTPLRNRYYVFRACLEDESEVDLHTGRELDWDRPRRASRNNHWWKYQLSLGQPARRRLRPAYASYLIRDWNSQHPAARHVASLELVQGLELPGVAALES